MASRSFLPVGGNQYAQPFEILGTKLAAEDPRIVSSGHPFSGWIIKTDDAVCFLANSRLIGRPDISQSNDSNISFFSPVTP
jgi:hypothetical protein